MMEEKNIFFKQKNMYDPYNDQKKVIIYGAGSIGSHVTIGLAKMGIQDITVIDFDKIESNNLPAQFYPMRYYDKEEFKVKALQEFCEEFTGTKIKIKQEFIDNDSQLDYSINTIHIMAFDNIEGRNIIFNKLKGFPVHLIDGRIGEFQIEKYYINMSNNNKYEEFQKTLEGTFSELECGDKTLWAVNQLIASKIIGDVIKLIKKKKPNFMFKGHLLSNNHITIE